jgi:hypothetical protein
MKYKEQFQKCKRELEQALRRQPLQIPDLCKQYLQNNIAKTLHGIIELTVHQVMGEHFAGLFKTLQRLDQDIYELRNLQRLPEARKPIYEDRVRYFATLMPDPERVKHLILECLHDNQLDKIRAYVSRFQVGSSLFISFGEFRVFFRHHKLSTKFWPIEATLQPPSSLEQRFAKYKQRPPNLTEYIFFSTQAFLPTNFRKTLSLSSFYLGKFVFFSLLLSNLFAKQFWFVLVRGAKLGFRNKLLLPNLEAVTALNKLKVGVSDGKSGKALLPVSKVIVDKFAAYVFQGSMEGGSLLREIETVVNTYVPNVNSAEFAHRLCERIVEEFSSLLHVEMNRLTLRKSIPVASLGRLALWPTPPPWALFWVPLTLLAVFAVQFGGEWSWPFWLSFGLSVSLLGGAINVFRARRKLRQDIEEELTKLVDTLIYNAIKSTSNQVTIDLVSQSVRDIQVQLRRRPLQRALDGLLE